MIKRKVKTIVSFLNRFLSYIHLTSYYNQDNSNAPDGHIFFNYIPNDAVKSQLKSSAKLGVLLYHLYYQKKVAYEFEDFIKK